MNTILLSESNSNINNEESNKIFETFVEYKNYYSEKELDEINKYIIK